MDTTPRTIEEEELLAQWSWIRGLARSLVGDPATAEDLAQEAWLAASTAPPAELRGESGLRSWLAAVLRNLARQSGRERSRRARREEAVARPEAQRSTFDVVSRGALHQELSAAVMSLPEPYRSAILMRYLDGLPPTEVANRQGVSHPAARKRISRGLEQLRAKLDDAHGGDRQAWSMALLSLIRLEPAATLATGVPGWLLPGGIAVNLKVLSAALAAVLLVVFVWDRLAREAPLPSAMENLMVSGGEAADTARSERGDKGNDSREAFAAELPRREWQVVDERGEPLADLLALQLSGGELVGRARTDRSGRFAAASAEEPDAVLLASASFAPVLRPLEQAPENTRLVVSRGARVAGRATLGGGPGPALLRLESDRPPLEWNALSAATLAALAEEGVTPEGSVAAVEADGAFHFEGLDPDWSGALATDGEWRFAAASAGDLEDGLALLLLEPAELLELELVAPRGLSGRLVDRRTREGVGDSEVWASLIPPGGRIPPVVQTRTDPEGRFSFAVAPPDADGTGWRLRLELYAPGYVLLDSITIDWSSLEGDDLGELELERGRSLRLLVRDAAGKPVAEAVASAIGSGSPRHSEPTGNEGTTTLHGLGAEDRRVRVVAPGHRIVEAELPGGELLEIELPASNRLELRVVDAAGEAMAHLRLRVACEVLPFSWAEPTGERRRQRRFRQVFDLDERGVLLLSDLTPGLVLDLTAMDPFGEEVGDARVATPGALERASAAVVVAERAFYLEGLVRDSLGRALPRAAIHAEVANHAFSRRTDANGAFTLGPYHSPVDGLFVEVSRPGFMTEVIRELSVSPDSPPLEVVLEKGRAGVEVRLTDSAGRPLPDLLLTAGYEDRATRVAREVENGLYRFELLPELDGTLTALVAGQEFQQPIGAHAEHVDFVLPAMGFLEVELTAGTVPEGRRRICVVCTPLGNEEAPERHYFKTWLAAEGAGPEPVRLTLPVGRYRVQLEARALGGPVDELGKAVEVELGGGDRRALVLP